MFSGSRQSANRVAKSWFCDHLRATLGSVSDQPHSPPPYRLPPRHKPPLPVRRVTVSDIASMNLGYYRKAAGLTQAELGEEIGWGKTVVSTAERSWEARRSRNFTADDLVLIAGALGIPVAAMLLPPEDDGVACTYVLDESDGEEQPVWDLLHRATGSGMPEGLNRALDAYRNRLAALGWQPPEVITRQAMRNQVEELAAKLSRPADGEDRPREIPEGLEQFRSEVEDLFRQRDELAAAIDDLRAFESEYRRRLRKFLESHYRALWSPGPSGANVDEVLAELQERPREDGATALLLNGDGTYDFLHPGEGDPG
jgi:transcriptional regulator with XRE-family HTH domain